MFGLIWCFWSQWRLLAAIKKQTRLSTPHLRSSCWFSMRLSEEGRIHSVQGSRAFSLWFQGNWQELRAPRPATETQDGDTQNFNEKYPKIASPARCSGPLERCPQNTGKIPLKYLNASSHSWYFRYFRSIFSMVQNSGSNLVLISWHFSWRFWVWQSGVSVARQGILQTRRQHYNKFWGGVCRGGQNLAMKFLCNAIRYACTCVLMLLAIESLFPHSNVSFLWPCTTNKEEQH